MEGKRDTVARSERQHGGVGKSAHITKMGIKQRKAPVRIQGLARMLWIGFLRRESINFGEGGKIPYSKESQ